MGAFFHDKLAEYRYKQSLLEIENLTRFEYSQLCVVAKDEIRYILRSHPVRKEEIPHHVVVKKSIDLFL